MSTVTALTSKRYPARTQAFAQRLYESGRSISEIRAALARRGHHPAMSTITYWCEPEAREAHNIKQRLGRYPNGRQRQREKAWWAKYRRMQELRDAGLSFTAIARIVALDFGVVLTDDQVRYGLSQGGTAWARRRLEGRA